MKFLILTALVAVAAAFPAEELVREKRGAIAYGAPLAYGGALVRGSSAVIAGPSGVIHADTGAIAAPAAVPHVVAPAVRLAGHTTLIAANPFHAGSVISPGAAVVGPSTAGHPGVVATPGLLGGVYLA